MRKPRRRRFSAGKLLGLVVAGALVAGAVTVYTVPGASQPFKALFASTSGKVITFPVRRGPMKISVVSRGALESSSNQDVYSEVEGATTIIKIIEEGSHVKKGDVVCELDSAALRDSLVNQKITTESAKANYTNAQLTREVAEIAVVEYKDGIFKQDLQTIEGNIKLAESDLARADDRLDWSRRMYKKGYVSKAQLVSEEQLFRQARFTLEKTQGERDVLLKFTKEKTIKTLESDVEKAHSDELAKKATWDLEQSKETKLEKQIKACMLVAPIDGLVVYANDTGRGFGNNQPQIEEGASVHERQKIISIPDIDRMQVNAKIPEAQIDNIAKNMKTSVRVDAFATHPLKATVVDVAALPDASSWFSSDVKVYTVKIRIDEPLAGLKPGMTAQVEVLVNELPNVLSVPVQALLQYGGKNHVTKVVGDRYEPTEVETGETNDTYVQVNSGLDNGDVVVMNPISLMTEDEKREAFRTTSQGSGKKWGGAAGKGGGPGAPGKGGPGAFGKGGGPGGFNPALFQKLQGMDPSDRAKLKTATPKEKAEILKKSGFSDAEIKQMSKMRPGGRGGRGGPGGPGGPGGGFGGGAPGGEGGAPGGGGGFGRGGAGGGPGGGRGGRGGPGGAQGGGNQ